MTSEIKEQVEEILSFCSNNTGERFIGRRLCALLRDLDAEPPKPTGEPAAFKRPCSTCGHQGNIMDKYCGSCGIEHLNWIPKSAECKNRVQVCPECNIDMYQDLSTKNAGLWVWYCPECGQEIKIT